jgi:hypothetical protein
MRRLLLAILCCGAFALCFGQVLAAGQDKIELYVAAYNTQPGGTTDLDLGLYVPTTLSAPGAVTVDVPKGYNLNVPLGAGGGLGDVAATVVVNGTETSVNGKLTTGDPAAYAADPAAQACAPGAHTSVWLATFTVSSQKVTVPVFIDAAPATDTADSFVMQVCFPATDLPPAPGSTTPATAPPRFEVLMLETQGLFTNPAATSTPEWRALFTAYTAGTSTPDPQTTTEARCKVPLPHVITGLKITHAKKPKHFPKVIITGRLMAAGQPRAGVHVRIDAGTTLANLKPWAVATTDAGGHFTITGAVKRPLLAFFYVDAYFSLQCSPTVPTTAPGGCVREDTAPVVGPLKILLPKP